MRTILFILLAFMFSIQSCKSQKTFLWQVENGNGNISYLLGINHVLSAKIADSFPIIKEKIQASEIMVRETNTDDTAAIAAFYEKQPLNPELVEMLTNEDKAYLRQIGNYGIDPLKFSMYELFSFLNSILLPAKKYATSDKSYYSIETYLENTANEEGKKLVFLEEIADNIGPMHYYQPNFIVNKIMKKSIPGLIVKLRDSATTNETPGNDKNEIAVEFLEPDFKYYLNKKCRGKFQEMFLVKRNNAWMAKLPGILENNRAFVSVGQEHLKYECGLITQLRNMNYTVTPLDMKTGKPLTAE